MNLPQLSLIGVATIAMVVHIASISLAAIRLKAKSSTTHFYIPHISIVRPLCGEEPFLEITLKSGFELDYQNYELLFCVADPNDPAIDVATRLMDRYSHVRARIFIGESPLSQNRKLNNCVKGWSGASHDRILFVDSNVILPPDCITQLLKSWRQDTGLVSSPPIATTPIGFCAELECAFLNSYQARWLYAADAIGVGFAHGKTMLMERQMIEQAGGIETLANELGEDAASTKIVRASGFRVRLVSDPFSQPIGFRTLYDVWHRQLRWAQIRRAAFPLLFFSEIFTSSLIPCAMLALSGVFQDYKLIISTLSFLGLWYGGEAALSYKVGWHFSWRMPFVIIMRDLIIPILWISGWAKLHVIWRGSILNYHSPALEA
jgi:ceramide glucosyltransferase